MRISDWSSDVCSSDLTMQTAIGLSADRIAPFTLEVRVGAGAYVCGEETALLDSIEGKRGQVRAKPPLPALQGLFGKPTVINNVLSLAALPFLLADGADAFAAVRFGRSLGTMTGQLAGHVKPGASGKAAGRDEWVQYVENTGVAG